VNFPKEKRKNQYEEKEDVMKKDHRINKAPHLFKTLPDIPDMLLHLGKVKF
jgi:hypothetical protein